LAQLEAIAHLPRTENWAVDGTLRLNNLFVARRDELTAQASGELRLAGTLAAMELEGAVVMERIDAQIPDQLPPAVVELPVVRIDGNGVVQERFNGNGALRRVSVPIGLDVTVDIPRRAFLRGRGLDSEWSGGLSLGGTMRTPRLDGMVSVTRGTFDLSRTQFDLTEGAIEFLGGDRIDPQIRLRAEAPGPEFTSIVLARGPVRRPTITITSDPVVPQETVMAQILFGKQPEELSAFELVQIAEATASLTGSGGFDILGSARRAAGLDVLSIGARESASGGQDVDVTVGRYVAQNVFVGARRGFEPGSGAVTVEMEVTPQVSVDAEVRQDAEGSVGVNWHRDY
jgi:autotransporter translocation and assembly factor TamB